MAGPPRGYDGSHAERARDAVERRHWGEAYEAYAAADRVEPLDAADLESWAVAGYLLGHVEMAADAFGRAHHLHAAAGADTEAARSGLWAAFILINSGEGAQASGWLARSTRLLEDAPPEAPERALLLVFEAYRLIALEHRSVEGLVPAESALSIARRAGDEDVACLAQNAAGRALVRSGRTEEGMAHLDEAMVAVVSRPLSPMVSGTVYCSVIEACEEISEMRRAHEWTEALTRWCDRQQGMVTFTGRCLTHRARVFRDRGDLESAAQEAEKAVVRFVGAADEQSTGRAKYELAEIRRVQGRLDEAEAIYEEAGTWGHDPQPGLALLRLAQGRIEAAVAGITRRLAESEVAVHRASVLPAAVEVLLAGGEIEAAETAAVELDDLARAYGTESLTAEADCAAGRLLYARGDDEAALSRLRRACRAWDSLRVPYEAARTRLLIAQACRGLGDEDAASGEEEAARRALVDRGADLSVVTVPDRSGIDSVLTGREIEVLRLVSTGMTNREVADELYVSVKTVDRHVANILTKLGVTSRTAATSYGYEHGLL